MREIKFRVWDTVFCEMCFDNSLMDEDYLNIVRYNVRPDQHKVMQYTGLKDKNGIEIYEGDIVKYKDYSTGAYFSLSGKDSQPRAIRVIKITNLFDGVYLRGFANKSEKLEVIGNIYQNPELLE